MPGLNLLDEVDVFIYIDSSIERQKTVTDIQSNVASNFTATGTPDANNARVVSDLTMFESAGYLESVDIAGDPGYKIKNLIPEGTKGRRGVVYKGRI